MANTFVGRCSATFAANRSMVSLFNASASVVIRVYRIWAVNAQIADVTGTVSSMEIQMLTGRSGAGTAGDVSKMDSSAAALDGSVYLEYNNGANLTAGDTIRRFTVSTDEVTVAGWTNQCWWKSYVLGVVWDAGYGDTAIQPITLRQNEGVHVKNTGGATGGIFQMCMEFTQASS